VPAATLMATLRDAAARSKRLRRAEDLDPESMDYGDGTHAAAFGGASEALAPMGPSKLRGLSRAFEQGPYVGEKSSSGEVFPALASSDDEEDEAEGGDAQFLAAMRAAQFDNDALTDDDDDQEDPVNGGDVDVVALLDREESSQLRSMSSSVHTEAARGRSAVEQLLTGDKLLEARIRLQPLLAGANRLPRHRFFQALASQSRGFRETSERCGDAFYDVLCSLLGVAQSRARKWSDLSRRLSAMDRALLLDHGSCIDPHTLEQASNGTHSRLENAWGSLCCLWDAALPLAEQMLDEAAESVGLASGLRKSKSGGVMRRAPSEQVLEMVGTESVVARKAHPLLRDSTVLGHRPSKRTREEQGDDALDWEAYDDTPFYVTLLKDLTSSGSAEVAGGAHAVVSHGKAGMKRVTRDVDRRASKGRKLRYVTVEKLVAFLAPRSRANPPVDIDTVLASLFQSDS
jgi:protein AATF/BFR2